MLQYITGIILALRVLLVGKNGPNDNEPFLCGVQQPRRRVPTTNPSGLDLNATRIGLFMAPTTERHQQRNKVNYRFI